MTSVFRRVFQRFLKPTYLAGRDLEGIRLGNAMRFRYHGDIDGDVLPGNKYYEYPSGHDGRPKRTVQYRRTDDMWAYVASGKRLSVQWNAWLTHTRPNPPSIEELQTDLARQHRVQMNAAIFEARDKEERERMALTQPSRWHASEPRWQEPEQARNEPPVNIRSDSAPAHVRDPWAEAKRGSDQPQSWTPVVRRK